ncbi:MAG TPA: flagellar biosynthetic protein FliR [Planctomycetaceae bacterium]|nr:flagellar biosynthetic protein FliR [Planctomycetaceae bacterium]
MDPLSVLLNPEQVLPWLSRSLVEGALLDVARFVLVLVRLSGLMIIGPFFGQSTVPINVRAFLVISLALIITPALPSQLQRGFARLDENEDGLLSAEELPAGLEHRRDAIVQARHLRPDAALRSDDYLTPTARPPTNLIDFVGLMVGELTLGFLLGLGVLTILSGLQLAGQIVDQQAGFSLGEIINPDFDSTASVTGQSLFMLGTTMLLVFEPLGGHLTMLRTLIQTFETLPVGEAFVSQSAIEVVGSLVQQSLLLGLRVAAPLVITMSLVDLTLGFLSHSVPQINLQVMGYGLRAGLCLFFLTVMLSGLPEAVLHIVPNALESLNNVLVNPPDRW